MTHDNPLAGFPQEALQCRPQLHIAILEQWALALLSPQWAENCAL